MDIDMLVLSFFLDKIIQTTDTDLQYCFLNVQQIEGQ